MADTTAVFGPGEAEDIAEDPKKRCVGVGVDVVLRIIDGDRIHAVSLDSRGFAPPCRIEARAGLGADCTERGAARQRQARACRRILSRFSALQAAARRNGAQGGVHGEKHGRDLGHGIRPVGREAEHAVGDGAGDSVGDERLVEREERHAGRRVDAQNAGAALGVLGTKALKTSGDEPLLERVEVGIDMSVNGRDAELLNEPERGAEGGEACGAQVSGLEKIGLFSDGPVVAQVTWAVEKKIQAVLVAHPARDGRAERGEPVGANINKSRAFDAHQPFMAAAREVIDAGRGHVERDGAAGLDSVDEDFSAVAMAEGRHFLERHSKAGLKLDGAHRDEAHPAGKLGLELGEAEGRVAVEPGERKKRDIEMKNGGGSLPGRDVGGEFTEEENNSIVLLPRKAEGDIGDAAGGALDEGDIVGGGRNDVGDFGAEALALVAPGDVGGVALAAVLVEETFDGELDGRARGRDSAVIEVGAGLEVGEQSSVAEARLAAGDIGVGDRGSVHGAWSASADRLIQSEGVNQREEAFGYLDNGEAAMGNQGGGKDSLIRDHLANERTFLAWIRTGLAMLGFGFLVAKLRLELGSGVGSSSVRASTLGILFASAGMVTIGLALWRYFVVMKMIESGAFRPLGYRLLLFALLLIVIGVAIILNLSGAVFLPA